MLSDAFGGMMHGKVEAAEARLSSKQRLAARFLLLIPAVLAVSSIWAVVQTYTPMPFMDQWDIVTLKRAVEDRGLLWIDLFFQHNEHRILFPRLIFLADYAWFEGRNILNLIVNGLTQLLGVLLIVKALDAGRRGPLETLGLAAAASMIVSLAQYENFFWGFQVQFLGVYAAGAWGIYAYFQADAAADAKRRWAWGLLAVACAVYATFNMANGVFAGFAAALAAVLCRRKLWVSALPLVVAGLLLAIYLQDYNSPAHHASPSETLEHPVRYIAFLMAYLGGPWTFRTPNAAVVAGALGVAATAAMFLHIVVRQRPLTATQRAMFGIVLFIGMTAGVTTMGRLNFGLIHSQSARYFTAALWFWAAQAVFWVIAARDWPTPSRRALAGVLVLALLMFVPMQWLGLKQIREIQQSLLAGESAVLGDVYSHDVLRFMHPDTNAVLERGRWLESQRLALYADPRPTPGPLSRWTIVDPSRCRGSFDGAKIEAGATAQGFGWGWDLRGRRRVSHVLIADDRGSVIGVSETGLHRPDVDRALPEVTHSRVGFVNVFPLREGELTAFGQLADGTLCRLGAWTPPKL